MTTMTRRSNLTLAAVLCAALVSTAQARTQSPLTQGRDARPKRQFVPVSVSAHHCHLSTPDLSRLFGAGHPLTQRNPLSQPGQFACEEKVTLVGPKGRLDVRVLGPTRKQSQVEITATEARTLGLGKVPVRLSGELANTPGVKLEGPTGSVELPSGLIVARRHLHATPKDARRLGLRNGQLLSVRVGGKKGVVFSGVKVRVDPSYKLDLHLDTDEGNAARIDGHARGFVMPK